MTNQGGQEAKSGFFAKLVHFAEAMERTEADDLRDFLLAQRQEIDELRSRVDALESETAA